jgi:hypothetical protein
MFSKRKPHLATCSGNFPVSLKPSKIYPTGKALWLAKLPSNQWPPPQRLSFIGMSFRYVIAGSHLRNMMSVNRFGIR